MVSSRHSESVGPRCLEGEVLRHSECISLADKAHVRAEVATLIVEESCLKEDADRRGTPCRFVQPSIDGDNKALGLDLAPEEANGLEQVVVGDINLPIRHVPPTNATPVEAGTCEHRLGSGDIDCRLP